MMVVGMNGYVICYVKKDFVCFKKVMRFEKDSHIIFNLYTCTKKKKRRERERERERE